MIVIQNYCKYADLYLFDPLAQKTSAPLARMDKRPEVQGFFASLGGVPFVIYCYQERLMLLIEDASYLFDDLDVSTNTISRIPSQGHEVYFLRHIKIYRNDKIIFEKDYNESGPYFEDDFTMYETEDFDFGLFLENLSKNRERQGRLFRTR